MISPAFLVIHLHLPNSQLCGFL